MRTIQHPIDYEDAIATLIRELPTERAAQLYDERGEFSVE